MSPSEIQPSLPPALQSLVDNDGPLTWDMPDGSVVIRPALILTVYFGNGYSAEGRKKIVACFDYFNERFGSHFKGKLLGGETDGKYTALRKDGFEQCRAKALALDPAYALEWHLSSEATQKISPEYCIETLTSQEHSERKFNERSYLKCWLPWQTLLTSEGVQQWQALAQFFCDELEVDHGYAGLSPAFPYDRSRFIPFEYPLSQQFSALMIDSSAHLDMNKLKSDFIKGVSWLTIVGNALLDKLGGVEKVKQQLKQPGLQVRPYRGGLIVQAGDYPALGGEEEGLPPLYVAVNRVFKPIRIPDPDQLHHHMPDRESFDKEATLRWYARFDVDDSVAVGATAAPSTRLRGLPEEAVPQTGWWHTPALTGEQGRRHFEAGDRFPDVKKTAWGEVIWMFDSATQPPPPTGAE